MKRKPIFILILFFLLVSVSFGVSTKAAEKVKEAIIKYKARNYSRALDLLKSASEIDSIYSDPYYWMGKIYLEQGKMDQAKKYAKQAYGLKRHEEKYSTLLSLIKLQKAKQAAKQNDNDKAISIADSIIEKNNKFIEGYQFKLELFLEKDKFKDALSVIKEVEKLADQRTLNASDDRYIGLVCQKALILFKQKKYELAWIEIKRWQGRNKGNEKVKQILALICSSKNPYYTNFNKGKKTFESKDYKNAKSLFLKAKQYSVSGEVKTYLSKIENILRAKKIYDEAVGLFDAGKFQEAILKVGDANQYFQLPEAVKLQENAEIEIDKLATIEKHGATSVEDPSVRRKKNAHRYFKQAISNYKSKMFIQAKDDIERVLKVYPNNKKALKLKNKIQAQLDSTVGVIKDFEDGIKAYKSKSWKDAIKKLESVYGKSELSANSKSSLIPIYITYCHFELGDFKKAKLRAISNLKTVPEEDEKLNSILAYCYYFESGEEPDNNYKKYYARLRKAKVPFAQKIASKIKKAEDDLIVKKASAEKWYYTWIGLGLCGLFFIAFIGKGIIGDILAKKKVVETRKDSELDEFVSSKKTKTVALTSDLKKKLKLAKTLYEKAAYDKAILNAGEILAVDPDNKNALLISGMSYIKSNEFSGENMQIFEKLTKLFPDNGDVLKGLCECYISVKKFTPTLFKSIKKVLEKEPANERFKEILEKHG